MGAWSSALPVTRRPHFEAGFHISTTSSTVVRARAGSAWFDHRWLLLPIAFHLVVTIGQLTSASAKLPPVSTFMSPISCRAYCKRLGPTYFTPCRCRKLSVPVRSSRISCRIASQGPGSFSGVEKTFQPCNRQTSRLYGLRRLSNVANHPPQTLNVISEQMHLISGSARTTGGAICAPIEARHLWLNRTITDDHCHEPRDFKQFSRVYSG